MRFCGILKAISVGVTGVDSRAVGAGAPVSVLEIITSGPGKVAVLAGSALFGVQPEKTAMIATANTSAFKSLFVVFTCHLSDGSNSTRVSETPMFPDSIGGIK